MQEKGGDPMSGDSHVQVWFRLVIVVVMMVWLPAVNAGEEQCMPAEDLSELTQQLQDSVDRRAWSDAAKLLDVLSLHVWVEKPLEIRHVVHINRDPGFFGDVVQRLETHYTAGETLRVYAEPRHYHFDCGGAGYIMDLVLDVKVVFENDRVVFHDPEFLQYRVGGIHPAREFFLNLTFDLGPGIPPGAYTLVMELTDQISGQTAEAKTEFTFQH